MSAPHLFIANRGETALRVLRSAQRLGWHCTLMTSSDEAASAVAQRANALAVHPQAGPQAYLDRDWIVREAQSSGAQALHPGIGFLSEDPRLAAALESLNLQWVGPPSACLGLFGNKQRALELADRLQIPRPAGSQPLGSVDDAFQFAQGFPAHTQWLLKAVSGGGGRGIRLVSRLDALSELFASASREAQTAFGDGRLYLEQRVIGARHIEVQVVGDRFGAWQVLGLRECSVQRRHQKLLEWSPPHGLAPELRARLEHHALHLAQASGLTHLGTIEFLLDRHQQVWFIEANPRLQLEHTVTEQCTGLDLVHLQLRITQGETLASLGLDHAPVSRGSALQCRINAEVLHQQHWSAATGVVEQLDLPGGPGVRVDTALHIGQAITGQFDSLVAKLIVSHHQETLDPLIPAAQQALAELHIGGVASNRSMLQSLLQAIDLDALDIDWFDQWLAARQPSVPESEPPAAPRDSLLCPTAGNLTQWLVQPGEQVRAGQVCAIVEAMKMEHEIAAPHAGHIASIVVVAGSSVRAGEVVASFVSQEGGAMDPALQATGLQENAVHPSLPEYLERRALLADEARPQAMEKRHAQGKLSAREQIARVLDANSFREYGEFAVAAQRTRRSMEDLIRNTPADGLITGLGQVHAASLGPSASQVAVMAYDYTVLAGTQGMFNHKKSDRLLALADRHRLPVVVHAEGGGGRPGDVDWLGVAGLDCTTFHHYGALAGKVPRIAVVTGRCFAGNAALAGASDLIVATRDTSLGMGGPAMIEGGGLGQVAAEEVGPVAMQSANGVIDLVCDSDAQACELARSLLGFAQGVNAPGAVPNVARLREVIPANRLRVYEIRDVITNLVDLDSFIELKPLFGPGVVTGLARLEGVPIGLMANNPKHLGGALDATACDKLGDFLTLCRTWRLPIVSLCDTPGFMVGPQAEAQGMVRKASRLFNLGAQHPKPLFVVVVRKGYGLGAQAMAGGSFAAPSSIVAWPSAEFGAMGLEGAVRLGFRKELEALDETAREALFARLLAQAYEKGKALNMASMLEIDSVIDPASTRTWLGAQLALSHR